VTVPTQQEKTLKTLRRHLALAAPNLSRSGRRQSRRIEGQLQSNTSARCFSEVTIALPSTGEEHRSRLRTVIKAITSLQRDEQRGDYRLRLIVFGPESTDTKTRVLGDRSSPSSVVRWIMEQLTAGTETPTAPVRLSKPDREGLFIVMFEQAPTPLPQALRGQLDQHPQRQTLWMSLDKDCFTPGPPPNLAPEDPQTLSDEAKVVGYSERGLVNSLLCFMRQNPSHLRRFLECCDWDPASPNRRPLPDGDALLNALESGTASITYIVETSFAQFGDPDLIIVINSPERRWRFFVEAKVIPYDKSAKENHTGPSPGMQQKGFNSSINGQLSLKYRLARALAVYRKEEGRLQEPDSLFEAAKGDLLDPSGNRSNPKGAPRHLEKAANLKLLVERHLIQPRQSPEDFLRDTWFIALTHEEDDNHPNPIPLSKALDKNPVYFEHESPTLSSIAWSHTGWSSWAKLREQMPSLKSNDDFAAVWEIVTFPP